MRGTGRRRVFGYININRSILREEDRCSYQGYYCGLCRELKARFGAKGQALLNYDMTFLIVLLTGLYELEDKRGDAACALHPVKGREMISNAATEYAADMNLLLAYHKLLDDWRDDRSVAKLALSKALEGDYAAARGRRPRQAGAIEEYVRRTAEMEGRREASLDAVSGETGEMLGEVFCWREDEWEGELRTLGFYMGKFIYLMDAYEDMDRDERKGAYNPLLMAKGGSGGDWDDSCRAILTSMMSECAKSFERLPILLHADILRNIIYSGVWSRYEYIQLKKRRERERAEKKGHAPRP